MKLGARILVLCLSVALGACSAVRPADETLYARLGGEAGITRIVDAFLYELAGDADVLPLFANTDLQRFRSKFIEQLCAVADGPCVYSGDSMRETHRYMNISHAQFNSVVTDLVVAMEKNKVATGAQNALLERLAKLYPDVVGR